MTRPESGDMVMTDSLRHVTGRQQFTKSILTADMGHVLDFLKITLPLDHGSRYHRWKENKYLADLGMFHDKYSAQNCGKLNLKKIKSNIQISWDWQI